MVGTLASRLQSWQPTYTLNQSVLIILHIHYFFTRFISNVAYFPQTWQLLLFLELYRMDVQAEHR